MEVDRPHRWVHTETVTTVLDEVRGKTFLKQTILYSSKRSRDDDFDAVAGSAADVYAKLEHYLESSR